MKLPLHIAPPYAGNVRIADADDRIILVVMDDAEAEKIARCVIKLMNGWRLWWKGLWH